MAVSKKATRVPAAAATLAHNTKTKDIHVLKLSDVIAKDQVRKEFVNIDELAISIETEGQQSPIIVSPLNKDGKYVIQRGERRWRACKLANKKTVDAIINKKRQSKADATLSELIENMQRENLTPLESANGFRLLIDAGWTQKKIAERLGKKRQMISKYLSLLDLPECVNELYEAKACQDIETLNNLRLLFGFNKELCLSACTIALEEGITRIKSRELLNDAKEKNAQKDEEVKPDQLTFAELMKDIKSQSEEKVYKPTQPSEVNIDVTYSVNGTKAKGRLLLDRVSDDGVWISTAAEDGEEQILFFPLSQVKITQIST